MEEKRDFCVKCGEMLPDGATFCPACGALVGEPGPGPEPEPQKFERGSNADLDGLSLMIFLYAGAALVFGLICFYMSSDAAEIMDLIKQYYPDEYQQLIDMGLDAAILASVYIVPAVLFIASGVCAIVSGYFVHSLRRYDIAIISCAASSVLSFPLIITTVIGIIVCIKIYHSKALFR